MNLRPISFALAALVFVSPAFAAEQSIKFDVPGMYCASCPFIVEAAMGNVNGVISVKADIETRTAAVVYDDALTTVTAIADASANAGYEAILITEGS